mmetsp:Transcript_3906/g.6018  ORF Transcript_3906/g.6018 Transcript_3906/m.6018 type:complete len:130 (-) Transcript_3906:71-460(-)
MVVPKTSTLEITTPTSRWVALLSKILLVVLILFLLPELVSAKPKKKNRALENLYNARITHCETGECGHLILEESMNCVTKCVSEQCYKEVKYDEEPLEDGEVDMNRAILFAQCVRNEILKERARGRTRK